MTRHIRCGCDACGCTFRLARKWITPALRCPSCGEAAHEGAPVVVVTPEQHRAIVETVEAVVAGSAEIRALNDRRRAQAWR